MIEKTAQTVVQCIHRSWTPVGKLHCSCAVSPQVYSCAAEQIVSGYCTPCDPSPGQLPPDGEIVLADGDRITPDDERTKKFHVWWTSNGEPVAKWHVIRCDKCRFQQDPPPHILKLKQLGIYGSFDEATGHCDVLHAFPHTKPEPISASGWQECIVIGLPSAKLPDAIDATGCALLILYGSLALVQNARAVNKAYPGVKVWLAMNDSRKREVIPNVWHDLPDDLAAELAQKRQELYRKAIKRILA